jgi:hypothetical protein
MPNALALYSGPLLTAADLTPLGHRRTAIVTKVAPEQVGQEGRTLLVLDLVSPSGQVWPKRCPLNKGNTLQLVTGVDEDYDKWPGTRIQLWSENVMFQGKLVPGIKVQVVGAPVTAGGNGAQIPPPDPDAPPQTMQMGPGVMLPIPPAPANPSKTVWAGPGSDLDDEIPL